MSLDQDLLKAHAANDKSRLATLYEAAADATNDPKAKYFYLTQAYIFALDGNAPNAKLLEHRLKDAGRL